MTKFLRYTCAVLLAVLLATPAMATEKHRQAQLFAAPVEFDAAVTNSALVTNSAGQTTVGPIIDRPADGTPNLNKVPAPTTGTTATDMTEAQLLGGIHVKTPTAAQNLQVPTGTEISAAVLAVQPDFAVGDSFDFTLINLGGTGDIVTLTVDTGVTFVGYAGVHPSADGATLPTSSGTFRFRNTAANTWVGYRVS